MRFILLLIFICLEAYPIKDMVNVAESAGSESWKLPDPSVAVSLPGTLELTLAYSTGCLVISSITFPLKICCAQAVVVNKNYMTVAGIIFFIVTTLINAL